MEFDRRAQLERLFRQHCAAVRAYARRRLPPDLADDVVSDVFVVAWRRLGDIPQDALPWLLACARKTVANQRRGANRREALWRRLANEAPLMLETPRPELGRISEALLELSDPDREVLMLIAWEELSYERAAVVLGCSPRAFAMRLHRARQRLSAALEALDTSEAI